MNVGRRGFVSSGGVNVVLPPPLTYMTTNSTPTPAPPELDAFVDELLHTAGALMLMLDHMSRFSAGAPPVPPPEPSHVILARLMTSVLGDLVGRWGTTALADATAIIVETCETVCDEILAVPLDLADGGCRGSDCDRSGARRRRRR